MTITDQSSRNRLLDIVAAGRRDRLVEFGATALVAAVALGLAAAMFAAYYAHPEELWRNLWHDRSAHYGYGLDLAIGLRNLNPVAFLAALEAIRVWTPLHPVLLGTILAFGNLDLRLATVPSLIGWVMTIVLAWLIARRLLADRLQGMVAGTLAVIFVMASPLFRWLAGDVMLETLGAALTALSLWTYMRAAEAPRDYGRWRAVAIALTLLFLEKENYWLLTVVALAIAVVSEQPRAFLAGTREFIAGPEMRELARGSLRDPLLIGFAIACVLVVAILLKGPAAVQLFGHGISLYPPGNLLTIAWGLLFIRIVLFWHRYRASFADRFGPLGRAMFYWHFVPLGGFLLLPERLPFLIFFVSPVNSQEVQVFDPWSGARQYVQGFIDTYHAAPWSAGLVAVLAVVAMLQIRRLTPHARSVFILLIVSTAAAILHPNVEERYLASFIFTYWIIAGAGGAIVIGWLTVRWSAAPRALAAAILLCALAAAHVRASQSHEPVDLVGTRHGPANDLDLAAAYLPAVAGYRHVGFVLSFSHNPFILWSLRAQCRCHATIESPSPRLPATREQVRQAVEAWAETTPVQRIVAIDTLGYNNLPHRGWGEEQARGMMDGMASQRRFERIETIPLPGYPAEITIWAPRPAAALR
jgi:hypothetical protein